MKWNLRLGRGGLVAFWAAAVLGATALLRGSAADVPAGSAPEGWAIHAPRPEIQPDAGFDAKSGPDGKGALWLRSDAREGRAGYWQKSFPVTGGKTYRFTA